MSKESRLSYHAVPRIMKTNVELINKPFEASESENGEDSSDSEDTLKNHGKRKKLDLSDVNGNAHTIHKDIWTNCTEENWWRPYADYVDDCRININVRQVLSCGDVSL